MVGSWKIQAIFDSRQFERKCEGKKIERKKNKNKFKVNKLFLYIIIIIFTDITILYID